jgi:glutamate 5-kinase
LGGADRAIARADRREVVLVSSGAIAEGMQRLGWTRRPQAMHELQAAAAVGQMGLVQVYESAFREHGLHTAQVLLTHADLADRQRYLNARSTLRTLLALGVIPIINENDTVVTDEIKFGDNDTIAALVTNLIEADCLIILTDQAGLFTRDPREHASAELVREAKAGAAELETMCGKAGSHIAKGGMLTKVLAAKRAARSGAHTVIASGHEPEVLLRLAQGEAMARCRNRADRRAQSNGWPTTRRSRAGCCSMPERALVRDGKACCPYSGLKARSRAARWSPASRPEPGTRPRAGEPAPASAHILGKPSSEILSVLGYVDEPELIHRDNLVLL